MTKSKDITKTIPAALASKIGNLTDIMSACYDSGFEDGFRDGKREGQTHALRRRRELAEAWNDHGQPLVTGIKNAIGDGDQTGMHGEPLFESEPQPKQPNTNWNRMTASHFRLVKELKRGFQSVPTLAGNLGVKKNSVWALMTTLKNNGYVIEKRAVSRQPGRNHKEYRLAKTA